VTANESDRSAIQPAASGAQEELWLTYLNYDQSIGQAVRRLGALSPENVDLFRGLLLKSRDRSKVKDYEAESIRRLQGEAFVGDEELQRTLIVLTAEDPRFGEELKRLVAATGKPEKLDQAVAAIRSGKTDPGKPAVAAPKDQSQAIAETPAKEIPQEAAQKPVKESTKESTTKESIREAAVVVPLHKERAAPAPRMAPRPTSLEETPETKSTGGAKRLAVIAAIVLAVVAGVALFVPISGNKPADTQVAAVPPAPPPQAAASVPAPVAPTPPAPAVDIPLPAQAGKNASSSPPLRAASAQPDAPANVPAAAPPSARSAPVAGSKYTVVRGDMLSDIAFQAYGDASKFRLIQAANPRIRNKDRILVDQVIFIPPVSR
jgi:hypothetical protein